jgi:ubiquinone biosynthesis accessory factor UbiJ
MMHSLNAMLAPAVMERLVLVVNHVLAAEPAAIERLKPHAKQVIRLRMKGWPALLPEPPLLAFRVTPAGLLEWCGGDGGTPDTVDLQVGIDTSNPIALMALALAQQMPAVDIDGDAALAADVNWLLQNMRWDIAANLERMFGPAIAYPLQRLGSALARALRSATQAAAGAAERMRSPTP